MLRLGSFEDVFDSKIDRRLCGISKAFVDEIFELFLYVLLFFSSQDDGVISDLENIAASTEYLSFINMHDTSKRIAKETSWPHFELKDGLDDSLPFDLEHQRPPFLEDWFSETYEISKEINKIAFKNLGLEGSCLVQDQTKNEK